MVYLFAQVMVYICLQQFVIDPPCLMSDYEYLFKFIMIGDSNVGKSCLLMRFLEGRFKNQHEPTLGVEFGSKIFSIKNTLIKIQVWDTAGQESFKSITRAYYKSSIASMLVFDISSESSFNHLQNWLFELKNHSHQKMKIILVGNKSDLIKEREISEEKIQQFIKKHNIEHYYETSALSGSNVEKPFMDLGTEILTQIETGLINIDTDTGLGVKPGKKKKNRYNNQVVLNKEPIKNEENQKCAC